MTDSRDILAFFPCIGRKLRQLVHFLVCKCWHPLLLVYICRHFEKPIKGMPNQLVGVHAGVHGQPSLKERKAALLSNLNINLKYLLKIRFEYWNGCLYISVMNGVIMK